MKIKSVFVSTTVLVALITCCSLNTSQAQPDLVKKAPPTSVPYCDAKLPPEQKRLQDLANENCTTQTSCIDCMDRASKVRFAATLVVHPNNPDCKPVISIEEVDALAPISRGGGDLMGGPTADYQVKFIQSTCKEGGNDIKVYIVGYETASDDFSYRWVLDGAYVGHDSALRCVSGRTATVKIVQLSTDVAKAFEIKLNPPPTDGGGGILRH